MGNPRRIVIADGKQIGLIGQQQFKPVGVKHLKLPRLSHRQKYLGLALIGLTAVVVGLFFPFWETISFRAVPRAEALSANELIEHLDVRAVRLNIRLRDKDTMYRTLWDTFANNPHERSFRNVMTDDWQQHWPRYSVRLVANAAAQKLDSAALEHCLAQIYEKNGDRLALLPVAAYEGWSGPDKAWYILCKWETYDKRDPQKMSHIRAWVFTVKDQEQIGFMTCD